MRTGSGTRLPLVPSGSWTGRFARIFGSSFTLLVVVPMHACWIAPLYRSTARKSAPDLSFCYNFRIAGNPSGKGRYFGPSHIAIDAANRIETKGHPLSRGKQRICPAWLYHNREEHHGIRGHQGSSAAQAGHVMVFAHVFLHLCRLFPAVAARAFARNARGKAAFRW